MISVNHIDRLAGALILDNVLRAAFLNNRLEAIETYNRDYVRRYGEKPIELNDEELQLVISLPAVSIEEFYERLDMALTNQQPRTLPITKRSYADSLVLKNREITAA